eukprot:642872-Alexandrium_andersonii.AAC.1
MRCCKAGTALGRSSLLRPPSTLLPCARPSSGGSRLSTFGRAGADASAKEAGPRKGRLRPCRRTPAGGA